MPLLRRWAFSEGGGGEYQVAVQCSGALPFFRQYIANAPGLLFNTAVLRVQVEAAYHWLGSALLLLRSAPRISRCARTAAKKKKKENKESQRTPHLALLGLGELLIKHAGLKDLSSSQVKCQVKY